MYFETVTKRRLYSVYTWSFMCSPCITNNSNRKNSAIKNKKKPATIDMSEDYQGIVQPWSNGPPLVSFVRRLIVNLRDRGYEQI